MEGPLIGGGGGFKPGGPLVPGDADVVLVGGGGGGGAFTLDGGLADCGALVGGGGGFDEGAVGACKTIIKILQRQKKKKYKNIKKIFK